MKSKRLMGIISSFLLFTSLIVSIPVKQVYADAYKVVTLGANLTPKQKEDMLKYFGVTKEEANVIEVTNEEERKYLGDVADAKQIGTKAISSSYVEPTEKGGLVISINNMYWVSESMIRNALITAGIENAVVKASAPFNVSGTAALTGILKGFESSEGGQKIDEDKKKAANEEIVVTGDLGEKVGKDEAAKLINEVKTEVIKEKPKGAKEIQKIVTDVADEYNVKLSDEDVQRITNLMNKINSLDIDFNEVKDQLKDVTSKLNNVLTSEEAQGFFAKLWSAITAFFRELFS
ncbi:DUF1002 domain-containing protein [Clostridium thermopalmarium]|uniref:DUF1002 domain-containing protein n=1 Tax=Clostridium thermopalmarium DSM 5974 TaxID=1121340 RepID=A0A2T0AJS5_9CLOT|nr:DUF1002 domain-containing protein [Clostridium thermopalmarium]PRR68566.1 hypothetical protein CPAL_27320 [Clostridium thermopalmarium DSM 5974]PVZ15806.1 uncharacterized protein YpuA (DUF1002 family) [Clostridium thermopalmarium DSM 5974]